MGTIDLWHCGRSRFMRTIDSVHSVKGYRTLSPMGGDPPERLQNHAHMRSGAEFLIKGVAAVCVLNVHVQLHQTAHLQMSTSESKITGCTML